MAFLDTSLAKAAFKKAFGKAHTGNAKDLGNESIASELTVASVSVFGEKVLYNNPSGTVTAGVATNCTGSNSLSLSLDVTSNGKAYLAKVPTGNPSHPLLSIKNPLTGVNYVAGDRVTRIIPQKFGDNFRAILKNNGIEVPPLDASDWFMDEVSGVVTSEDNLGLTNGTLECYIYVGKMLDEVLETLEASSGGGSGSEWVTLQYAYNNGQDIDLDGYSNLTIHSEVDAYGLDVNVRGEINLVSQGDMSLSTDGYMILNDGFINHPTKFTDPTETYGTSLITERQSIIGAINEAYLRSAGGAGGGSERAVFVLASDTSAATGMSLSSPTIGTIELAPPEGPSFSFTRDVFVYVNGQLQIGDVDSYETNGNTVIHEVSSNSAGTKLYFKYDLREKDTVQVYNTNNQV